MIDGSMMKGKRMIIQTLILPQLHSNNMRIENTGILACESVYWLNINTGIEIL